MMDVVVPIRSRDMVDEFIMSGDPYVVVDVGKTGRDEASVYNALLTYLKRHDDLGISVRKIKGDIVLVKDAKQGTSS